MKIILLRVSCYLIAVFGFLTPASSQIPSRESRSEPRLVLNASVVKKQFCSGNPFMVLTMSMRFTNLGVEPILLDRRSKVIGEYMVSRNLQDAGERKYVQKVTPMLDSSIGGFSRGAPDNLASFAVLMPGESYSTSTESRVNLLVGNERESLRPGKYLLQLKVITWYYYPQESFDRLRVQWRDSGYLWSKDIVSEPMTFEVDRNPRPEPCTIHS